jgi:hypothetical protein
MTRTAAEKDAKALFGPTVYFNVSLFNGKRPRQGSVEAIGRYRLILPVPANDPAGREWKDWPTGTGRWNDLRCIGSGASYAEAIADALVTK